MTAIDFGRAFPSRDAVLAELRRRKHPIWRPQKGPQTLAYYSKADILGYGGAAGGGKSDLIVGLGLTQHRRGIIFRREGNESRDLLARAGEILDGMADYRNPQPPAEGAKIRQNPDRIAYIPRGDRQLEFDGLKNPDDWRKHRGRAKDFHAFDEATEFPELMIRQLIGWNRTVIPGQRCRVVLTFNPPSPTRGQWLFTFFAPWLDPKHPNPAEYGELRFFTTVGGRDIECPNGNPVELEEDGEMIKARCAGAGLDDRHRCTGCGADVLLVLSRTFIKALLDDNEYLRDTNYRATLMGLPEPLRSQLLHGDFMADEPDAPDQCIPTRWVLAAQDRWVKMARPEAPLSAIGVDVARGGKDRTAFCARVGNWFDEPVAYPGIETPEGSDVIKKLREFASRYKVTKRVVVGMDVVGVGSSPADLCKELAIQLAAMSGGEREGIENETDASGLLYFANKRAMWYWRLREALDPEKGEALAIPPDRELLADLCAPKWRVMTTGIVLESKEDISKRLGRSPDKGDALVYAFAARPLVVGYETVASRPSGAHITTKLAPGWKTKRGL